MAPPHLSRPYKKPRHWALIFTDEASFRQDSTLPATGSRVGCPPEVPVTGERKNVKILGAIELWRTRFDYRPDTVFHAATYRGFLEQLARRYRRQGAILIQDNAQGRQGLGLVPVQPALAGSASVAVLLAGMEPYRTAVAAHP